jgi:NADH dehydrogenase
MNQRKNGDFDNRIVVLTGGNGFLGARVAQQLLARGARLRVVSRRTDRAYRISPMAAIGQLQTVRADVTSTRQLEALYAGAHAAVNLVGAFRGDLDALQGEGAGRMAAAAREAGASAFVHVSAIGADPSSASEYARTKGEGELAVSHAFPGTTIVRPSVLFGDEDRFINMFAGLISRLPVLPVFGPSARLQPLDVDDAAEAIATAAIQPGVHGGRTYEIAGPEVLTMLELNRRIAAAQGRKRVFVEVPDWASAAFATATGWLPGAPLSPDQWALLKAGSVASGALPGIEQFGVSPRPLSLFLDRFMVRYRRAGRFADRTRGVATAHTGGPSVKA